MSPSIKEPKLKRTFWKRIVLIVLALTTLFAVVGCKESAKYAVMAERLYYDYTTDAAAADEMYKNTKVQVTGIIRSLGTASTGQPYIILAVGDLSETCGVQCSFTSKYASLVNSLSVGQQITISGECLGYSSHVVIAVD
jgi:RecG-like helicase